MPVKRRRNGNGYVVYPGSIGFYSLAAARKEAKRQAQEYGRARVENVDTNKTIATYGRNPAGIRGWVRAKAVKIVRDKKGRAVSVKIKT